MTTTHHLSSHPSHHTHSSSLPYPSDWSAIDLCAQLRSSLTATAAIDAELNQLLAQRTQIERTLSQTSPLLSDQLDSLLRSHNDGGRIVSSSNRSAQGLASKVRELDEVAEHVAQALTRVESVLALRHTITRVRQRIQENQLLPAAEEIWRALYVATPIQNDLSFSLLLELETKLREEVQREAIERYVRQARSANGQLESKEIMRLARIWPKLGFAYRGLIMYCAQVRLECIAVIHKSGWSLQNQHEHALIDYPRNVSSIIETVNGCIIQHLLLVQSLFGNGAQIRLIQELLTNVIDLEVASKLMARFIEEKKIRDPKGGTLNPNTDDVISRIKIINQKVLSSASQPNSSTPPVSYYSTHDPSNQLGGLLNIQSLDELLDEMKVLASEIENFIKGVDQLTGQSMEFLNEAVSKERAARDAIKAGSVAADQVADKRREDLFARFMSTPSLASLPSVHEQHERVMTVLHKLLHDDKHDKNVLGLPVSEEAGGAFADTNRQALPTDGPIPPHLLNIPTGSSSIIAGFGLDANTATASRLYDTQLTLISKYVLVEEYYMNYNVEKAIAIDEHDGASLTNEDGTSVGVSHHDDLESELEASDARKERERAAAAGGLGSLASAISSSNSGIDPSLYLTGMGAATNGMGLPKTFLAKFVTHKTSTLVDNVCFLYKKCIQRSLKTSNRDAIYSILLRVHENFNKKLRKVFEGSVAYYESRFGSRKKSSASFAIFQNPGAYLFPAQSAGGSKTNLLGAWVTAAGSGLGGATQADVQRKVNGDVSIILTVNNLDSTIENMQALLKYVDHSLDDLFGDDEPQQPKHISNYTRGLSLDQMKEKVIEFHATFQLLDQLIGRGLQCIADNVWLRLLPRLTLLQAHATELYSTPELTSSSVDLSEQLIGGYIDVFKRDVLCLAPLLNENNFYQTVFKVVKLTVRFLENLVLPKASPGSSHAYDANGQPLKPLHFTQSGGVQFDKQIRTLTSFFSNDVAAQLERHFAEQFFLYLQPLSSSSASSLTDAGGEFKQWRVSFSGSAQARQLFSKLAHVGSILSVDRPAEVLEYTERELFNLKKDEVRRILSLRTEFRSEEISQLKL